MCCHPVCRRQAAACDQDHTVDWDHGGPTCPANLTPLCKRHHHLKHDGGWRLRRLDDGTVRWTTPTGHTYDKPPDPLPQDTTITADTSEPAPERGAGTEVDPIDQDLPPPF